MSKHLPIGGSTATRTLECPGWVKASASVPKGKSSVYADEGNLLHDAMENWYQYEESFASQLARKLTFKDQVLTQDLIDDYLVPALDMVETVLEKYDIDEYICEPFVEYIPDLAGGSIDMLGRSSNGRTVIVLDYKFGHAPVNPATSAQLPFYALSAWTDEKTASFFEKVEALAYVIIQPKVSHEPITHEVNASSLEKFEKQLDHAIYLSQSKNPPTHAGTHCQYCPVAPYCDTKKAQVKSSLLIKPKDATTLAQALQLTEQMGQWIKDVEKAAHELMEKGAKVPGYKLVQKRALRKWKNTLDAEDKLGNLPGAIERKMKSPAQIEKIIKKEKLDISIDELVTKESSGTTVVPETDKREAVTIPEISDSLKALVG